MTGKCGGEEHWRIQGGPGSAQIGSHDHGRLLP